MHNDREKLIEILKSFDPSAFFRKYIADEMTDYLISHGVVVRDKGKWILEREPDGKPLLGLSHTKRHFLEWLLNGFINGDIQQIVKCEDCKFYCSGNEASWCEHNEGLCYEMSEPNNGEHWCCFGKRKDGERRTE